MENICFVVNKYPNEFEPYMLVFLQQLAWEFADMGKKVTVICPLPVNLNRKYLQIPYHTREYTEKKKSIDIYWPKTAGLGQSHYVLGRSPVGITTFFLEKAAERVIRSFTEKPDVIYGHFMAPSGIAVARLSDTFKIPAFFALGESHNTIEQFGAERAKEELKDIAGVIAVSTYLKRSKISSLNALFDDIIGNPQAIASTIALLHPSFNVGNTKMSAALLNSGISSGFKDFAKIQLSP